MTTTETQYFALLRAALWNKPVVIQEEIDWKAVMELAKYHANDTLLCGVASTMTGDNKPSSAQLEKMKLIVRANLFNYIQLKQILISAVQQLRQHDIEPVLLKGFGLAMLYPNPNLRQFGDIDIFVGIDVFHQACALLRELPGCYNWGEEIESGHHYNIEFGRYPMEVHRVSADVTDPREAAIYARIEREGLMEHPQRVNLEGFPISIPSKEFVVFFTFYHAWHHFLTTGVGWRQISDVAVALNNYNGQFDLETLRRYLTDMHLLKPWQTFGYLMVHQLGLPETELPFYDASCRRKAQRLYCRIMEEGNFKRERKFKRNRPKRRFWQKLHAFICMFIDFFHIAKIFPGIALHQMLSGLKSGIEKNLGPKKQTHV